MKYEEMQFCRSCAMPLEHPNLEGMSEGYCEHCTGDDGKVRSKEEVKRGIAQWFMSWQHVDEDTAMKRAEHYMNSMPEWADTKDE